MKFLSAFLAAFIFVSGASAQTPSAPLVIKDWCDWVLSLEFSPNGGELARFCFGYAVALIDTTNYRRARTFLTETEHTPQLQGFAYSPDGTMIATTTGGPPARESGTQRTQVSRYPMRNGIRLYINSTRWTPRSGFSRHPVGGIANRTCHGPGSPPTANF